MCPRPAGERAGRGRPRCRRPGYPVPRDLRRVPAALRGVGRGPGHARARGAARAWCEPCRPGSSTPRCSGTVLDRAAGADAGLLAGAPDPAWVYFVHSFAPEVTADTVSTCDYGGTVTASAERGPVWGTQFHPEKSGPVGLAILANFVDRRRRRRRRPGHRSGPLSGHRHPGRQRGPAGPGGLRPSVRSTGIRSSWPAPSPTAARPGCTWSTSTRPAPATRSTAPPCWPSPPRWTIPVQTGGGVRGDEDVDDAARPAAWPGSSSAPRCSTRPDWRGRSAERHPGRVAVGLDYRLGRRRPGRGGRPRLGATGGRTVAEVLDELAGVDLAAVIVTAIERDGMLAGPDLEGLGRGAGGDAAAGDRLRRGRLGRRHPDPGPAVGGGRRRRAGGCREPSPDGPWSTGF